MYITGSNLPFVWFFTESGSSKSGLTPKVQHLFRNGIEFMGASGSAITALGGGTYRFLLSGSNVNVVGDYEAIAFITGTADIISLPCRLDVFAPIQDLLLNEFTSPNHLTNGTVGQEIHSSFSLIVGLPDSGQNAQTLLETDLSFYNTPGTVGSFLNKIFSLDDTIEGPLTLKNIIKIIASALFGKSSGGGTASVKFRDTQNTKDRISATVDANGNRTNVTLDGS